MFLGLVLSLMGEGFGPRVDCSVYHEDCCNTSESLLLNTHLFSQRYFSRNSDLLYPRINRMPHSISTLGDGCISIHIYKDRRVNCFMPGRDFLGFLTKSAGLENEVCSVFKDEFLRSRREDRRM